MLRLALPITLVQVGLMLMGVTDTVIVGRVSAVALASVALGNLYFFVISVFGMGVLMALDPIVAQAVGAGDRPAVARALQRGFLLAAAISLLTSLLFAPAERVFAALGQPAEVTPMAAAFVRASIPGTLPFFAFIVLRQSLQALGRTGPILVSILIANIANIALDLILVFGRFGLPALGGVGSAWASSASRWVMLAVLLAAAWRPIAGAMLPLRREAVEAAPLGRMIRVGVPIGAQGVLEYGVFALVAILMGRIGAAEVAAHQVAINIASLTFMVPLGVGAAAAVLVGRAVGRGDAAAARSYARAALACGALFMSCTGALFLLAPGVLARLYTTQAPVIALASLLIPLAGVFQIFDGVQAVAAGVLRGLGDTLVPLVVNILGFWLIGLPVSLYLGFRAGMGPLGLWWGLVVGLAVVAVVNVLRVRVRLKRDLRRLVINEEPIAA